MSPLPDAVHAEPGLATQLQLVPSRSGGRTSVTVTDGAALGPPLATTIV